MTPTTNSKNIKTDFKCPTCKQETVYSSFSEHFNREILFCVNEDCRTCFGRDELEKNPNE